MGKWEAGGWLSNFPPPVAAEEMWESHSDFQSLWAQRETCFRFSSASIGCHFLSRFHALRFSFSPANSLRLASCIWRAACVSLSRLAWRSSSVGLNPGFR